MTEADRVGRGGAVMAKLALVGDLLALQLLFLVCSLGIVTLVPAAFALQRVLPGTLAQDHPGLIRRFWRELKWAFRRFWLAGLGLYVGSILVTVSVLFWVSSDESVRLFALAVLLPLAGLAVGLYVSALAVLPQLDPDVTPRGVLRAANLFLVRRPLPVAGVVVALTAWMLLLAKAPTLFVITSGLLPALLAYWISRPVAVRNQSPTEND